MNGDGEDDEEDDDVAAGVVLCLCGCCAPAATTVHRRRQTEAEGCQELVCDLREDHPELQQGEREYLSLDIMEEVMVMHGTY